MTDQPISPPSAPQPAATASVSPSPQLSPDGRYWWNGQQWVPVATPTPVYGISSANNGMGTAGGVVGIVGLVLFWVPYVGFILGAIGVALGAVGLQRANRMGGAGKGMAITGIVCGVIALALDLLIIISIINAVNSIH